MAEDHDGDERPGPSKAAAEEKGDKEAPNEAHAKGDGSDSDETAAHEPEPPFYTPGCPSTTAEEEAAAAAAAEPEGEGSTWADRAFLAWVLCGVGAAIVVIPLAFLVLPLLFPSVADRVADNDVVSPTKETSDGPPSDGPGGGVDPSCILPSPGISGDVFRARTDDYFTKINAPDTPPEFYCLYNNSRYRNTAGKDFLPKHVPFVLCPKLVYWSMAITDGTILSRQEAFDRTHGLYKLRDISTSQLNDPKAAVLLMTLGGYPEDSGHFHRLATNNTMRHRLVSAVYQKSLKYMLNGTNVHWVRGNESCERGLNQQRWRTLSQFLDDVFTLLSLNEFPIKFLMTVMIDPYDLPDINALKILRTKTNITFLSTHLLRPEKNTMNEYCEKTPNMVKDFLIGFLANVTGNRNTADKSVCVSVTLGISAWASMSEATPAPAQPISKTEGRVAMSDVCKNKQTHFQKTVPPIASCDVYKAKLDTGDVYCAFDDSNAATRKYRAVTDMCMLVYDIDFDNFFESCNNQELFMRLRYYLEALKISGKLDPLPFVV